MSVIVTVGSLGGKEPRAWQACSPHLLAWRPADTACGLAASHSPWCPKVRDTDSPFLSQSAELPQHKHRRKVNYPVSNSSFIESRQRAPHRLHDLSEVPHPFPKAITRFHVPYCDCLRVHVSGFFLSIWRLLSVWKQGCYKLTAQ